MLALVTIFLTTLLISVVAIWLYRTVSGWQGFSTTVVARRGKTLKMRLKPQQGFITMLTPTRSRTQLNRSKVNRSKVNRSKATRSMATRSLANRIRSTRVRSGRATPVRLRSTAGAIKAPWGW